MGDKKKLKRAVVTITAYVYGEDEVKIKKEVHKICDKVNSMTNLNGEPIAEAEKLQLKTWGKIGELKDI